MAVGYSLRSEIDSSRGRRQLECEQDEAQERMHSHLTRRVERGRWVVSITSFEILYVSARSRRAASPRIDHDNLRRDAHVRAVNVGDSAMSNDRR